MRVLPPVLAVVLLLALPGSALAVDRFATPNPDPEADCSVGNPCDIFTAVAGEGNKVFLASGEYNLSDAPLNVTGTDVEGAAGAAPRLVGTASTLVNLDGADLEHVIVERSGSGTAVSLSGVSALRDSLVIAPGGSSTAVRVSVPLSGNTDAVLRHVTAIAPGTESAALRADALVGTTAVTVVNSILSSGVPIDVISGLPGIVQTDHSAYDPNAVAALLGEIVETGTVAAAPVLTSDYRQAAGSPTIDAGTAVGAVTGATDIDGTAFGLGSAPDIGADELVPAVVEVIPPVDTGGVTGGTGTTPVVPLPTFLDSLSAGLPGGTTTPVVGKRTTLTINARDNDAPIGGVIVDLGEGLIFGESACRLSKTLPTAGPFAPGTVQFRVPVTFTKPGAHTVEVTVLSGGCGDQQQQTTSFAVNATPSSSARAASVNAVAAAGCANASAVPTGANTTAIGKAVLCLMNKARKTKRLKKFRWSKGLAKAAAIHNNDMVARGYYEHQKPPGPALGARLRRARYRGTAAGENLGLGGGVMASPAYMMQAWLASPPHRANILNKKYRAMGLAVAPKDPTGQMSTGAAIYTVDFGNKK